MKKLRKVGLIVGGTVVGIIILILVMVFVGSNGVGDAAEDVLTQLNAGQIETVYQNSALAQVMTYEEFQTAMQVWTAMDLTKAKHISWNGRGFENEDKYIYWTFELPDGLQHYLTFWFQEVEGNMILMGITGGDPEGKDL